MKDSYRFLFMLFLRFGLNAWGGPVAQIAMLQEELVTRRQWITQDKFKRVLAVYQALPGPEAHEICVYFGMLRAGRLGGILAGLGFMLPGFILMLALSYAYVLYGSAALLPIFAGITPVVAALILRALWRIGKHSLHDTSALVAAAIAVLYCLLDVHFGFIFALCGLWQALYTSGRKTTAIASLISLSALVIYFSLAASQNQAAETGTHSPHLLLEGLKAGMLSFGGAYTVIPFLQQSLIGTYPAITHQAFMDGIALSNVIPAPLVIFGTFLGFVVDGLRGALYITIGIFLPAFSFTLIGHSLLEKLIENRVLHGLLEGICAAVVGVLALTTLQILLQSITGILPALVFTMAFLLLCFWKWRWSVPFIIFGGACLDWIVRSLIL